VRWDVSAPIFTFLCHLVIFVQKTPSNLEDEVAGFGEVEAELQQTCQTTGKVCPSVLLEKGDVILLQDLPYSHKQQVIVM